MAEVDKETTAAEATALFDRGIAKIKANEMEEAIEALGKCLELRTAVFGEQAVQTAQAYHKYGCALFYKAQDENTVFGARAQEAADAKKEADGEGASADEGEDVDDAAADAPPEGSEEGKEEDGEQEGAQDDMELAWEMIEMARLFYEEELEESNGEGGHPIELANVYEVLGDINTETSNFKASLEEYSKCLALLEAHVDEDDRRIAGVLCSMSVCQQFEQDPEAALKGVTRAIGILNARIKRLKSSDEAAAEAVNAALPPGAPPHDDPLAVAKTELETIEATIGDLAAREEELRSVCSEDDATREQIKKAFAAIGGNAAGGEAAPVRNADGSIETIGFDAPTRANAGPVTNLGVVGGGKKGAPKRIVAQVAGAQPGVTTSAPPAPAGSANAAAAAAFAAMAAAPGPTTAPPAAPPAAARRSLEDMMGPAGGESVEGFGGGVVAPAEAKKAKIAPEAVAPAAENAGEKENAPNGCPQQ